MNKLLFLTKNNIPFIGARIEIHQPTIREISYLGESNFFIACNLIHLNKEKFLKETDKNVLENKSNFEILMMIINDINNSSIGERMKMLLMLLFPNMNIQFQKDQIALLNSNNEIITSINEENFLEFQQITSTMFCLKQAGIEATDYNPQGPLARKIAEKLRKGRERAAQSKGTTEATSIFDRYISILAVGENKDINNLLDYTVYQLFDEFKRFELKQSYNIYLKAKMAGAGSKMKEPENWMDDIHNDI